MKMIDRTVNLQWKKLSPTAKGTQTAHHEAIMVNLEKAETASEGACNRWLNLSKTRMDVLRQAWSTRW